MRSALVVMVALPALAFIGPGPARAGGPNGGVPEMACVDSYRWEPPEPAAAPRPATLAPSGPLALASSVAPAAATPVIREIEQSSQGAEPPAGELFAEPKRTFRGAAQVPWASLNSSVVVEDGAALPDGAPAADRWQTDESWGLKTGRVSLFGQFGAVGDCGADQVNLTSRTGVAYKVPGWPIGEVQFRGGPRWTCPDARRLERFRDHSDLLLEMLCSWPLPGRVKAEFQSSAVPALNPEAHDHVDQDFRVAVPLGAGGQLQLGAKNSWENVGTARPWTDTMQLYLGLTLKK